MEGKLFIGWRHMNILFLQDFPKDVQDELPELKGREKLSWPVFSIVSFEGE